MEGGCESDSTSSQLSHRKAEWGGPADWQEERDRLRFKTGFLEGVCGDGGVIAGKPKRRTYVLIANGQYIVSILFFIHLRLENFFA